MSREFARYVVFSASQRQQSGRQFLARLELTEAEVAHPQCRCAYCRHYRKTPRGFTEH